MHERFTVCAVNRGCIPANHFNLFQGVVRVHTGGDRLQRKSTSRKAELVRIQYRRYSPDGRNNYEEVFSVMTALLLTHEAFFNA